MLTNDEIADFFTNTPADIAGNVTLRRPQIEGYEAVRQYFADGGKRALAQIPVGCGKSGLITLLPFAVARGRVLVIAPNLQIKDQLARDLDSSSSQSFYAKRGVLSADVVGPFRAELDATANRHDCDGAHIVVTNIQQLAERPDGWLSGFPADYFDLIIVDEGHHNAAPSWQRVFEKFPAARVISLTATPFRADGAEVEGDVVYAYSFRDAMVHGYIKAIHAENVAPVELYFTYAGDPRRHTLDEVRELREESWFSKGVALAEECNISIVDGSIQWLEDLRASGTRHQLIGVACSIDHARQIRALYQERGLEADVIHSKLDAPARDEILRRLRSGALDVIVQVAMLGEGFDHPLLSVAAVFRPYRSLNPYIQFVGRIMRVNAQNAPNHLDNRGVIVSHVGLNIERHWADFKRLDAGDAALIEQWTTGTAVERTGGAGGTGTSLWRDGGVMDVQREVLSDRFISDSFLADDAVDDAQIDGVLHSIEEQGIDLAAAGLGRDEWRRILAAQKRQGPEGPKRLQVQPQDRRKAQKQRLVERVKSEASVVCSTLGLPLIGVRIPLAVPSTNASNNLTAVIVILNRKVNDLLGVASGQRGELSLDQIEQAMAALSALVDEVKAELTETLH